MRELDMLFLLMLVAIIVLLFRKVIEHQVEKKPLNEGTTRGLVKSITEPKLVPKVPPPSLKKWT